MKPTKHSPISQQETCQLIKQYNIIVNYCTHFVLAFFGLVDSALLLDLRLHPELSLRPELSFPLEFSFPEELSDCRLRYLRTFSLNIAFTALKLSCTTDVSNIFRNIKESETLTVTVHYEIPIPCSNLAITIHFTCNVNYPM